MNPAVSLDAALLQPGIPEGAKPHLADISKDLLAHLDGPELRASLLSELEKFAAPAKP